MKRNKDGSWTDAAGRIFMEESLSRMRAGSSRGIKKMNAFLDAHPEIRSKIGRMGNKVSHDEAHRADPKYHQARVKAGRIGGKIGGPMTVKKMNAFLDAHPEIRSKIGKIGGEANAAKPGHMSALNKIGSKAVFVDRRPANRLRNAMRINHVVQFLRSRGIYTEEEKKVGPYRLDVWVPSLEIDVEADGWFHSKQVAKEHDRLRDAYLVSVGIRVVRIPNAEVDAGDFHRLEEALGDEKD